MAKAQQLTTLLSMPSINGSAAIGAIAGLFSWSQLLVISFGFLAGPGALILALMLPGETQQRMIVAGVAGCIATGALILSAGMGPLLLQHLNLSILKIMGGLSVIAIGLLIMGIRIPSHMPTVLIVIALVLGVIIK